MARRPYNLWKKRNFDTHLDGYTAYRPMSDSDFVHSNTMYDMNKGITHAFVHTARGSDHDFVRLVSDVEICMSNDPEIMATFTHEYRSNLRNALMSAPRSPVTPALSDDELMSNGPCPTNLERDEISALARDQIDRLDDASMSFLRSQRRDAPSDQPQPSPSPTPQSTPQTTE